MAMNGHFGCKGPEGWHIVCGTSVDKGKRSKAKAEPVIGGTPDIGGTSVDKGKRWRHADLQREKRVNEMPEWVRDNIFDLVRDG